MSNRKGTDVKQSKPERSMHLLEGSATSTARQALSLLQSCVIEDVGWMGQAFSPEGSKTISTRVSELPLGITLSAVVLDFHGGLNPDMLAAAAGMVRSGGAIILRMDSRLALPWRSKLYSQEGVSALPRPRTSRFGARWLNTYQGHSASLNHEVQPSYEAVSSTPCQDSFVEEALRVLSQHKNPIIVVHAARGRGKSYGVGRLLRSHALPLNKILLTGPNASAVNAVIEATGQKDGDSSGLSYTPFEKLSEKADSAQALVVDEAATVPLHSLQKLCTTHHSIPIILSTTTEGYEGTGRGFAVRFIPWLEQIGRPSSVHTLSEPIRFALKDPVEVFLRESLLLPTESPKNVQASQNGPKHAVFTGEELLRNERVLKGAFQLLVEAHYRTVPTDLERLMDSPNMRLHTLMDGDTVLCASIVADEGGLSPEGCKEVVNGRKRLLGHALPENALSHMGIPSAGELRWLRSVRIAVPRALRRHGLASDLVNAVHGHYSPDLFGTLFGCTPGLFQFRESLGYKVVRMALHRGTRSGEPSAMMVRPVSEKGLVLFRLMRKRHKALWPYQLDMMTDEEVEPWPKELLERLAKDSSDLEKGDMPTWGQDLDSFAFAQRTLEGAIPAVLQFLETHRKNSPVPLHSIPDALYRRCKGQLSWEQAAESARAPSVRSFMRQSKRYVAEVLHREDPDRVKTWSAGLNLGNSFDES